MKTILVTGGDGQLAMCIKDLESNYPDFKFTYTNSSELDISNLNQVNKTFSIQKFDWCINCAAYTAVDLAETEIQKAHDVNQIGAKNLALACKQYKTKLIHISTDFVFDGNMPKAYTELIATNPLGIYGLSKLKGEQEITSILSNYFIIRTSWLYSEHGNNFLKTMLRLASTKDEIGVVSDQIGAPTYAKDLAQMIIHLMHVESNEYGIYNFSNQGIASWYDFAKAIFELSKSNIKVNPIPTSSYPTPAKRPPFSVLDTTKIKTSFQIEIPYWRDSLKTAISNLK